MSREEMAWELKKAAIVMRKNVHEKVKRGECEGRGHDKECPTCEYAYYCTELRHMPNLFLL